MKFSKRVSSVLLGFMFLSFSLSSSVYGIEQLKNTTVSTKETILQDKELSEKPVIKTRTSIIGQPEITKGQAFELLRKYNKEQSDQYIYNFVQYTWEEACEEGVRPDVAFLQMMKETGYLKFGGDVLKDQNNFAGLGATGGGVRGASFPDVRTGIRAVIQHLKAYASKEPLKNDLVDPRYDKITNKGCAPYVEDLGGRWAVSPNYGVEIVDMLQYTKTLEELSFKDIYINLSKKTSINSSKKTSINSFKIYKNGVLDNSTKFYKDGKYKVDVDASSSNGAQYRFWVGNLKTRQWTILQDYSDNNTITWTPNEEGIFEISVHVRDKNSQAKYETVKFRDVNVVSSKAKVDSFEIYKNGVIDNTTKFNVGNKYTVKASASSSNGAQYRFWVGNLKTRQWTILQDYSDNNTITWIPKEQGRFEISVHTRDRNSQARYEGVKFRDVDVLDNSKAKVNSFQIYKNGVLDNSTKFNVGAKYTVKASASSSNGAQYRFWVGNLKTRQWTILQDYSDNNTITWIPKEQGRFEISVHTRDRNSQARYEGVKFRDVDVLDNSKAKVNSFQIYKNGVLDNSTKFNIGTKYTVKASASSSNGAQYRFWVGNLKTRQWTILQDYSDNNTITWTPKEDGRFEISVHTRDRNSQARYEGVKFRDVDVKSKDTQIEEFKIYDGNKIMNPKSNFEINKVYTVKVAAKSFNTPQYRFWVGDLDNKNWTIIQDYSNNNETTFVLNKPGNYEINVHVRDSSSNKAYEKVKFEDIKVVGKYNGKKLIVLDAGHGKGDSGAIANGVREDELNQAIVSKLGKYIIQKGYNLVYTRDRIPNYTTAKKDIKARADLANNLNADLFLSIHNDAFPGGKGTGTHYSTYRPNLDNSGIQEIGDVYYDRTPCDAAIKSKVLADMVVNRLSKLGFSNRGSKDHNLYVTRMTNMPSILVECGFITSIEDVTKLKNPQIQDKIAKIISECVDDFFN